MSTATLGNWSLKIVVATQSYKRQWKVSRPIRSLLVYAKMLKQLRCTFSRTIRSKKKNSDRTSGKHNSDNISNTTVQRGKVASFVLETCQMATRGKVLCQGITHGLISLGFPWLSQAEQWQVQRGTWQTRVPRGSCYIE